MDVLLYLLSSLLLCFVLIGYDVIAQPTVDGRFSNDKANYTFLTQEASGRGEVYFNRDGGTLYLLVRVDQNVNDKRLRKDRWPRCQ